MISVLCSDHRTWQANKEVIMYRHYDAALQVTHHIASYSNTTEGQPQSANLALLSHSSVLTGEVYQSSTLGQCYPVLDLANMIFDS